MDIEGGHLLYLLQPYMSRHLKGHLKRAGLMVWRAHIDVYDARLIAANTLPYGFTDPTVNVGAPLGGIVEIDDPQIGCAAASAGSGVQYAIELTLDRLNQDLDIAS
ncbi:hypothetical protein ATO46_02815 [Aeromonas schubertii]|nr:hypothetical protein ATO46_02815 [Aeromonas schubertii]